MFVGRLNEISKLDAFYKSNTFEMVVVYGRRRVGKTRLLTEFIKDKQAIFFVAEENNDLLNKQKFTKTVLSHFDEQLNINFEYWDDIFKYIANRVFSEKLIIVLDELPYLALGNTGFLSMLQNVIDHDLLQKNIMLVLCGSSISFMEDEIVSHKSPIYGRKAGQMKVLPLDYRDARGFFSDYSVEEQFKAYAILGGIPHYLLQFNADKGLEENIINKCMRSTSIFYDEPKNLLHQELRSPAVYNAIIEAIAGGASKINDISTKIGEETSKTSKYIQSLLELEIIIKQTPMDEEHSRKSIYKINDPLFNFMYRFVYRSRSLIEQDLGREVFYGLVKDELQAFYGMRFEVVCLQFLQYLNKSLKLEFLVEAFGSWWGNNPVLKRQEEIDIVGLSKDNGIYCECKYRNEKVGIDVYEKLVERSRLIPRSHQYYYLFSKSGFTEGLMEMARIKPEIKLIGFEDLYG